MDTWNSTYGRSSFSHPAKIPGMLDYPSGQGCPTHSVPVPYSLWRRYPHAKYSTRSCYRQSLQSERKRDTSVRRDGERGTSSKLHAPFSAQNLALWKENSEDPRPTVHLS